MEKCQFHSCQNQPENLCTVHSLAFCESHIITHLKSEGTHLLEDLYTPIPSSTLSSLKSFLFKSLQDLNTMDQDLDRKTKVIINKILTEHSSVKKTLKSLKAKVFDKLQQISHSAKVSKISKDPVDQIALKDEKTFLVSLANFNLPKVQINFPETKIFSITAEDVFYQEESNKLVSIVAQLKSMKNKFMLFEYAKGMMDKESQETLLKIIMASGNNPELECVAGKAFTILSKHHYNFSGLNLNKLNLSNAEVTGGKFIATNFAGCNFSQVKLNNSVLRPALIDFYVYKSIEDGKKKFKGHTDKVTVIRFTNDGRNIVTGSEDKLIIVWDLASGHSLNVLEGHVDGVMCLEVTPDKLEIVSGGRDGIVKLWDLTTGACFMNYTLETGRSLGLVSSVTMTSNKAFVIAATWSETVIVWSKGGKPLSVFSFESSVWAVATNLNQLADNSYKIIIGCRNGDLTVLKTGSDKVLWKQKEAHKQWIGSISVSKTANHIVTSGCDGYIRLWNLMKTGISKFMKQTNYILNRELKMFDSSVNNLRPFANFKFLFASNEETLKIFERKKLGNVSEFKLKFNSYVNDISNFGTYVAVGKKKSIMIYTFNELFKTN